MTKINDVLNEYYKNNDTGILPLLPTRDIFLCPGMNTSFDVAREISLSALESAIKNDGLIILSAQKNSEIENPVISDLYEVGVLARITNMLKAPYQAVRVTVSVLNRVKLDFVESKNCFYAKYTLLGIGEDDDDNKAMINVIKDSFASYLDCIGRSENEIKELFSECGNADDIVDVICQNTNFNYDTFQEIVCSVNTKDRLTKTYNALENKVEMIKLEVDIEDSVRGRLAEMQKEIYVKEKIHALQEEIGLSDDEETINKYRKELEKLPIEEDYRLKVEKEINRLESIPIGSAEAGVIQTYVETILDLPWDSSTKENLDLKRAKKILDENHYGLDDVKDRIIEYLAVIKLSKSLKSQIICLVGPPGVGKTSIASSIAEAVNRKFIRMSVGGTRDESEIKGHRRTYVGSMPGRIINSLKQCKVNNPLFLIDEIDKIGSDYKGDPAAALLEVLDPEQNSAFTDTYLEIPFDLSKVMFITTANTTSTIPPALLDRMEVINISGYMPFEKLEITKHHLVKKQLENSGLKKKNISFDDEAIISIIDNYTMESGVRNLDRNIAKICRKVAKEVVVNKVKEVNISKNNLKDYLGQPISSFGIKEDIGRIGKVTGLAWTSFGGDTLDIEVLILQGKGHIQLTGKLGDVMQESAKAAISYVRSIAEKLKVKDDFFETHDIHIHVPEGATPKDGPSAGITLFTALVSAITKTKVPARTAMTGEITLTGEIIAIGGLREKLLAANRACVNRVLIPKDNEKDLEKIPKELVEKFEIKLVTNAEEVYNIIFE